MVSTSYRIAKCLGLKKLEIKTVDKFKLRDENGKWINRCNRCGAKLEKDFALADKEPVCLSCAAKIKGQYTEYFAVKNKNHRKEMEQHRKLFYEKAINKLIDGKGDVEYTKQRWQKLKQIKRK